MKLTPKMRRNLILGGTLLALTATPSFAIFGLGDIVWDPTNYAEMVTQATTAYNHLKAFQNNITHFTWKGAWQTEKNQLVHVSFKNEFGETSGMDTAMTTNNPAAAQAAWKNATVQTDSNASTYVGTQPAGSPARAQLAAIEANDVTSTECMNAVGAYRAALTANDAAESSLKSSQLDGSTTTNSEVQQLNLVNASQAQQLVELKQQGMVQACMAQHLAVASMQQRNAQASDLNTWGFVQQQQQTNNANQAGSSNTWTTYLP